MHTGGIDGLWKISKGAVSSSWSACCGDAVNPEFVQAIEFGSGDGTVEIAKIASVSNRPRSDQMLGEVRHQKQRYEKQPPSQMHKTL